MNISDVILGDDQFEQIIDIKKYYQIHIHTAAYKDFKLLRYKLVNAPKKAYSLNYTLKNLHKYYYILCKAKDNLFAAKKI